MKKKFAVIFFFALIYFCICETVEASCQNLKTMVVNNMNNLANCSDRSSYGFNPGYLMKGQVNGQCHYQKVVFETKPFNMKVLANCYAPMSFMQKFAQEYIRMAQEMCNGDKLSGDGYITKMDEKALDAYCK